MICHMLAISLTKEILFLIHQSDCFMRVLTTCGKKRIKSCVLPNSMRGSRMEPVLIRFQYGTVKKKIEHGLLPLW